MICFDSVMLAVLISILMLQTGSLLIYLKFGLFSEGIFEASFSLFIASWTLSGIVLVYFAKQATHYRLVQFCMRAIVFFPVAVVLTNCLIGLHPRILSKVLKFMGITETHVILDAVVWIYCCKIVFTGLFDTFAQVLVASHNTIQAPWVSSMFVTTSIIVGLTFFLFSVSCYFDVIKRYIVDYEPILLVKDKLLKPLVFEFTREDPDTCTICREFIMFGQLVAEMPICSHNFHDM
mmetsp:Transcript_34258/g.59969  ORF Transcript_34258/g.59969 Transcript_34258/m.59969 type:complete len:235 (-) Transcript_34258:1654-2358(-)